MSFEKKLVNFIYEVGIIFERKKQNIQTHMPKITSTIKVETNINFLKYFWQMAF